MNPPPFESEDRWTGRLAGLFPASGDVITGIGDDAAVVRSPGTDDLVFTTDAVIAGVHAEPDADPFLFGRKMAGRLLSDLAAMGARPSCFLLNLETGPGFSPDALDRLYEGAGQLAGTFGMRLAGGDTVRGPRLALHGFASGTVPRGCAVLRSGARPGHVLYVTGELGGSIGGRHLRFDPRVGEGIWLREGGFATAMMDVSDGLLRDLPRLCRASGTGVEVAAASIPVSRDVAASGRDALIHALGDGEDYELLFTTTPERAAELEKAWRERFPLRLTRIGVMTGDADAFLLVDADGGREPFPDGGFDHLGG